MPSTVDVRFIVFENTSSQVKKDSILYRYPDFRMRKMAVPDMSNSIETAIAIAFFGTIAIGIAIAKAIFQLLLLLLILLREFSNYCYCYWYC